MFNNLIYKIMRKSEFLSVGSFRLVRVNDTDLKVFPNIDDFDRFVNCHDSRGFKSCITLYGQSAVQIFKFFVIDISNGGFVLNSQNPCNYEECLSLIHMYL